MRDLPEGIALENRPDLVASVFNLKLEELMKDLTEKLVLSRFELHTYVIEFQKRGLPHAHTLTINDKADRVTKANVDGAVQAVIPPEPTEATKDEDRRL